MPCRYATRPATIAEHHRRIRFDVFMDTYWMWRAAWVDAAEAATSTTPGRERSEELANFELDNPPPLFRNCLIASAGEPR